MWAKPTKSQYTTFSLSTNVAKIPVEMFLAKWIPPWRPQWQTNQVCLFLQTHQGVLCLCILNKLFLSWWHSLFGRLFKRLSGWSKFSECGGSRVFTATHMIKKKSHSVGNIPPTSSMKMLPSEAHVSFKKQFLFTLLKCHLHLDWTCVEHLLIEIFVDSRIVTATCHLREGQQTWSTCLLQKKRRTHP